MSEWYLKDPNEVLDYQIDWADFLAADTIVTSSWSAESGITVDGSSNTTTTATVILSGGTAGNRYVVTNRIVTAGGRTSDRSLTFTVAAK